MLCIFVLFSHILHFPHFQLHIHRFLIIIMILISMWPYLFYQVDYYYYYYYDQSAYIQCNSHPQEKHRKLNIVVF